MLSIFRKSFPDVNYPDLIDILERNDPSELTFLLLKSEKIRYLPITFSMLDKMAKPHGFSGNLRIYERHNNGKYELAIFEVPWDSSDDIKFLPLILDKSVTRIVGVMLPFNELIPILNKSEQKQIHKLSSIWMTFIMARKFGIKREQ
jgi:hypothetical protein